MAATSQKGGMLTRNGRSVKMLTGAAIGFIDRR
jgi:hypothetical protein